MLGYRRSKYDVTNLVNTTDVGSVSLYVAQVFEDLYRREFPADMRRVFADVGRLYRGEFPEYHACETEYHNIQHILDVTLAMARLLDGGVRAVGPTVITERLFRLGIVGALLHDIGYLRRLDDIEKKHGAEYTRTHVGRGAAFITWYLPSVGLGDLADAAAKIVHFTGYEVAASQIQIDPQYRIVGNLLGSADILAQMADRCYLEKCRDRLYPELVLGGIARQIDTQGDEKVMFASPADLIFKTPGFFKGAQQRLKEDLGGVYRYADGHFKGDNLYFTETRKNISYASVIAGSRDISLLRRSLPDCKSDDAA